MKTPNAIRLQGITKSFGNRVVLDHISLNIPRGSIFGIIGRSGAGKSTLMRCLNGLESPDSGQIDCFGQPFTKEMLQKVGTIFQSFNLIARRTVLENITLPLEWRGVPSDVRTEKAKKLADLVGLSDKIDAYPATLSGGQRQRVAIARALATDAPLLLCDEFTSALDPETSLDILELLRDLNQRLGVTVILITHDMTVVRECCDYVCVLDQGKIAEHGPVENVLLSPQHDVTRSLLSGLFIKELPHMLVEKLQPTPGSIAVMRLIFVGKSAQEPIISTLMRDFNVAANIIAGHLDHIRTQAFGSLIVTIPYEEKGFQKIKDYMAAQNVAADILGYLND